ncbi:MAG: hypothetical protein RIR62_941 [Pseudomonadota bacterium]|jgi:hypothetical protein
MHARQAHDLCPDHIEFGQRCGKADRFGQTVFGQAAAAVMADVGMQDPGPRRTGAGRTVVIPPVRQEIVILVFGQVRNQSSPS